MDSKKLKVIVIITLALLFALYLGVASATAQFEAVAWIGGLLGITILIALGRNVWILIPTFTVCEGFFNILPGTPELWVPAGAVVTGIYMLRLITKREGFIWRWSLLDFAVAVHLLCLLQTWVRNPVGLMIMGGEGGGGRAYLMHIAAIVTYACLSVTIPTVGAVKLATIARVSVGLIDGVILLLQGWSPKIAALGLKSYVSPVFAETSLGQKVALDQSRLLGARYLAYNLIIPAFCLVRPLRCLSPFHIIPFLATVAGVVLILLAGFRSGVAYFGVLFILASIVRKKPLDAIIICILGAMALIFVATSGLIDKMPFGVQRALSAFGVKVKSESVLKSAEGSSEDRFEVWEIVLTQKGYIKNKWLGDGFAMSRSEYDALIDAQLGFKHVSFIDRCLITGNYHGFHVATIKYAGVLGLLIAVFLMGVAFRTSLKLIAYYRHTELFPYVLYACLPVMLYLPWSLFVYGTYTGEFPKIIVMAGMIKLLENLMLQKTSGTSESLPNQKMTSRNFSRTNTRQEIIT